MLKHLLLFGLLCVIGLGVVACDAVATAYTWQDINCNGKPDEGEPPLGEVCVQVSNQSIPTPSANSCWAVTSSDGQWWSSFMTNDCNQVYVAARSPDGFEPTTATVANRCDAEFGFAKAGTCPSAGFNWFVVITISGLIFLGLLILMWKIKHNRKPHAAV